MNAERRANHGQSSHGLRGDYGRMRPDYTVDQDHGAYTEAQHDRWRRLYRRQIELVPGRACDEYLGALRALPYEKGIPRFEAVNAPLGAATRWQLVAVPGLVPDLVFFDHLANRRFPVTCWIREEHEFAYIVEPDVFHDFFGHVPMLFDPVFADYMQAYGRGGVKAEGLGALQWLARLYWYTVEFGLIRTPQGLRNYGAGILSSPGEVDYAVTSPKPRRVRLRPRAHHAQPLPHRRVPGDLLRDRQLPAAVRRDRARLHAALPQSLQPLEELPADAALPRGPARLPEAPAARARYGCSSRAPGPARRPRSPSGARKRRRCSER